jgi:bacterioferritin-associated ferredoxin
MIVCHCNVIACSAIREAVKGIRAEESEGVVTPGRVFRCCGQRPQCGGCMNMVSAIIADEVETGRAG